MTSATSTVLNAVHPLNMLAVVLKSTAFGKSTDSSLVKKSARYAPNTFNFGADMVDRLDTNPTVASALKVLYGKASTVALMYTAVSEAHSKNTWSPNLMVDSARPRSTLLTPL